MHRPVAAAASSSSFAFVIHILTWIEKNTGFSLLLTEVINYLLTKARGGEWGMSVLWVCTNVNVQSSKWPLHLCVVALVRPIRTSSKFECCIWHFQNTEGEQIAFKCHSGLTGTHVYCVIFKGTEAFETCLRMNPFWHRTEFCLEFDI